VIVSSGQMQASEAALFASGLTPESLMEEAGRGCAEAVRQFVPGPAHAILFVGRGHNGGDALVAGRWLRSWGWNVSARLAAAPEQLAPLTRLEWSRFEATPRGPDLGSRAPMVVLDGLLGIGARGPLREPLQGLAGEIHALGRQGARIVALDVPSGVDPDTGEVHPGAVAADLTLAIAHPKNGLLEDRALDAVGRLAVIPLPALADVPGDASRMLLTAATLGPWLPPRPYSTHKSAAGRVGIVAGSVGTTGAAVLCATGALRAGAGLVTVYCPLDAYPIIAGRAPAEAMVRPWTSAEEVAAGSFHALALGPGLGSHAAEVRPLVLKDARPAVVDADSLNDLARHGGLAALDDAPAARLLTPHPGELARLWPEGAPSRLETNRAVMARHRVPLLHKGSRTLVSAPGHPDAYNATGHPGMATGGIGDVLSGVCAAFLARGIPPYEAACLGSWLVGHAAELALLPGRAPEGLVAGDVADHLPEAMNNLRLGVY